MDQTKTMHVFEGICTIELKESSIGVLYFELREDKSNVKNKSCEIRSLVNSSGLTEIQKAFVIGKFY